VKTANASPASSRATVGGEPPSASFAGSVKAAPARREVTSVRVDAEKPTSASPAGSTATDGLYPEAIRSGAVQPGAPVAEPASRRLAPSTAPATTSGFACNRLLSIRRT
jgi:hypothetical protein